MNTLFISAHMDDEVLGCGGTIARHVTSGDRVFVAFMAHRIYNRTFNKKKNEIEKRHARQVQDVLGYKEAVFFDMLDERLDTCIQDMLIPLEKYIKKVKPDVVYCPFRGDNSQDHRAVFDAARIAIRPSTNRAIRKVLMYEIPSSTEQSPPLYESAFLPNYYVDITKYIDKKIKAYRCYKTEKREYPHPRSEKGLRILAQKRGIEIGLDYAEAFMIIRDKWE